jgi:hypothetical protein
MGGAGMGGADPAHVFVGGSGDHSDRVRSALSSPPHGLLEGAGGPVVDEEDDDEDAGFKAEVAPTRDLHVFVYGIRVMLVKRCPGSARSTFSRSNTRPQNVVLSGVLPGPACSHVCKAAP